MGLPSCFGFGSVGNCGLPVFFSFAWRGVWWAASRVETFRQGLSIYGRWPFPKKTFEYLNSNLKRICKGTNTHKICKTHLEQMLNSTFTMHNMRIFQIIDFAKSEGASLPMLNFIVNGFLKCITICERGPKESPRRLHWKAYKVCHSDKKHSQKLLRSRLTRGFAALLQWFIKTCRQPGEHRRRPEAALTGQIFMKAPKKMSISIYSW